MVPASLIIEMYKIVPVKLCNRSGNRSEIVRRVTRGDVKSAKPYCAQPYSRLDRVDGLKDKPEVQSNMIPTYEGRKEYMKPNPEVRDMNDPAPPQDHPSGST